MNATKTRKTTRKPLTDAEKEVRKNQRAERIAALEAVAESFELDEEDRKMMRAYESLCSHYSEGNAFLILAQADEQDLKVKGLADVGAYGTFKAAGRMVKTGEHASIFIWAPAGSAAQADKTEEVPASDTPSGGKAPSSRKFWRLAPLFHVSQTRKMTAEEKS